MRLLLPRRRVGRRRLSLLLSWSSWASEGSSSSSLSGSTSPRARWMLRRYRALQSLLRLRKQRNFPSGLFTNGLVRRVDSETTHASHSDRR